MSSGEKEKRSAFSRMQGAYGEVIRVLQSDEFGYNEEEDVENFRDTAKRAAKAITEMVWPWSKIRSELEKCFITFPTGGAGGMVDQHDIMVSILCPHHLMPAVLRVSAGYIPMNGGRVLGISKIARVANILAKRPVLQEAFSSDLADVLCDKGTRTARELPRLASAGSAVRVEAVHTCMTCRGAEVAAVTGTTEMRGEMNAELFYRAIQLSRSQKMFGV